MLDDYSHQNELVIALEEKINTLKRILRFEKAKLSFLMPNYTNF